MLTSWMRPWILGRRSLRVLALDRWLFRWPSTVRAGSVRECWASEIENDLPDDNVLYLLDIFPIGYVAA